MKRQIQIKNADHYLFIPIQVQQEKKTVLFSCGDRIITELRIPVGVISNGEYKYNYLACIPLWLLSGDILSVEGDVSKDFLDTIFVNSHVEKQILNHPHIHFAAEYGWINDPNGLVYCNGLYHLYFQYNPFDTTWDNMSWGHAVSKDLLHWEQRDMALLPDDDGMIFSGCGLINKFGLLDLPKDSLLYFYSAAGGSNRISKGKEFIQKVAYSLDEGNTLIKTDSGIIPTICKENRDPKVFWHEKTNAYIMCLWLEHSEFVILRSIDLKEWKISQRFTLDQGFECPDLFELPVEQGGTKWVFWCADGFYYLGEFDGYTFETDEKRREAYSTKLPYAAQTISNIEDKVISIPWLRTRTVEKRYTGVMGIPREFTLVEQNGDIFLKQMPVYTIEKNQRLIGSGIVGTTKENSLRVFQEHKCVIKIDTKIFLIKNEIVEWYIYDVKISYEIGTGRLIVEEEEINIGKNISDVSIIFDKGIIEITANYGIIYAVFESNSQKETGDISIDLKIIEEVNIYQII